MNAKVDITALPFVRLERDQTWFDAIPGERLTIRVHSSETGGKFSIMESIAGHGTATPTHTHVEDEVFHILAGEVIFSLGGEISVLTAGDAIYIPGGTQHAWRNSAGTPARMLAFFSPGGVEQMFTEVAGLELPQIVELASKYGTVIVGPPIEA
ncbi:cupin domain-containing protein [Rhizobium ruizarguesonis]|jgi:quercetin dioxygenase-like cupin family protein|uniref:cupin domain-containing protein n=1 Tax=Rhizobium TaxID=379 RepID=UPI001030C7DC|nr:MULTISPECIES: cupin domain-containing protein [Rhizobium]QND16927.1 cupin domain-containing protein [Rhizobium leguminosarum bv. trifolii]TCA20358.1 cupin domain-containing protein [Rhizobium leguminosarum bv. viciae]NEH75661.1 cupin domain-containing protein [Rhizobium ruizarguesonis]NEI05356.1 cupin domain-containing protein [Rhizobium ruizarguesonis]NEI11070.1 cupin domain-containing protein [Rhizobium ruizarguesonis]